MDNSVKISVVLGSYNRFKYLKLAIASVRKELETFVYGFEIIVVDGGSIDGSIEWLRKQKDIITIIQHNRGEWLGKKITRKSWGYFMNLGFKCAQGKYICMLSDDCLVVPGAILNGYVLSEEKISKNVKVGGVAFYWRNWPEQHEYSVFYFYGVLNINHGLYLRQALIDVGFAEEKLFRFYYGDIDLAFKISHIGYEIIDSENSFIEHYMHVNEKERVQNFLYDNNDGKNFVNKWSIVYGNERFIAEKRASIKKIIYDDPYRTAEGFELWGIYGVFRKYIKKNKKQ